ncbi:hypothetical protein AB1Y20_003205 [Prymnesium parvum]|uniref:Uncharacterized protein n=1 Tax=Prymnesium parvum TaxID=97485 RepID=A0AB34JB67_PRYPA
MASIFMVDASGLSGAHVFPRTSFSSETDGDSSVLSRDSRRVSWAAVPPPSPAPMSESLPATPTTAPPAPPAWALAGGSMRTEESGGMRTEGGAGAGGEGRTAPSDSSAEARRAPERNWLQKLFQPDGGPLDAASSAGEAPEKKEEAWLLSGLFPPSDKGWAELKAGLQKLQALHRHASSLPEASRSSHDALRREGAASRVAAVEASLGALVAELEEAVRWLAAPHEAAVRAAEASGSSAGETDEDDVLMNPDKTPERGLLRAARAQLAARADSQEELDRRVRRERRVERARSRRRPDEPKLARRQEVLAAYREIVGQLRPAWAPAKAEEARTADELQRAIEESAFELYLAGAESVHHAAEGEVAELHEAVNAARRERDEARAALRACCAAEEAAVAAATAALRVEVEAMRRKCDEAVAARAAMERMALETEANAQRLLERMGWASSAPGADGARAAARRDDAKVLDGAEEPAPVVAAAASIGSPPAASCVRQGVSATATASTTPPPAACGSETSKNLASAPARISRGAQHSSRELTRSWSFFRRSPRASAKSGVNGQAQGTDV